MSWSLSRSQRFNFVGVQMRLVLYLWLLPLLLTPSARAQEPIDVTLVRLVATPEKFDGKLIRVIGFLRLEFEGNVLYIHQEDYEKAILGNGVWVDVNPLISKQKAKLDLNYVLVEGVFSSTNKGHMDMWSGAISQVRRAELWIPARNASSGAPSK